MPIKYGEITIIRNTEYESLFNYVSYAFRLVGYETTFTDKDTIIILFDDDTIYNTKDEYIDKEFKINISVNNFPIYFDIKSKDITLFYKYPVKKKDGTLKLDYGDIHKNYKNYENSIKNTLEPSIYNVIYESVYKNNLFSIVKIKSNEEKPRFLVTYEDKYLDKSDIIYLVDSMFKEKFKCEIDLN